MRRQCSGIALLLCLALANADAGKYKLGDKVLVRNANIHPLFNPSEKYDYWKLPWVCQLPGNKAGDKPKGVPENDWGSALVGDHETASLFDIRFRKNAQDQKLCAGRQLTAHQVTEFRAAIKNSYEAEVLLDELPVDIEVGTFDRGAMSRKEWVEYYKNTDNFVYYIYTHTWFDIEYNGDRVISVRAQPGRPVAVKEGAMVEYTYNVVWTENPGIDFTDRGAYHLQANPTKHQMEAHWLWVLNSSLLVVLLTGLLSLILLRTLKNDVARYLHLDQLDAEELAQARKEGIDDEIDDSGWKRIRFNVFRAPAWPMLYASIVGCGAQILMVVTCVLVLAVVGYFYPGNQGRLYVAIMVLYLPTAYIAGFIATSNLVSFKATSGEPVDWMKTCALVTFLYSGPVIVTFGTVNTIAWSWGSSVSLDAKYIVLMVLMWAFVTFPLTAYGSYKGSKCAPQEYPCKPKIIPRHLPTDLPWYYHSMVQVLVAGFLPFMAIYVEVHTIFNSVWVPHQAYTLFGILLLTFLILLIVTAFVVILLCYFQLTSEDYRWWWSSILRGGSTGFFFMLYAAFYWSYSEMSGALQGAMFFGYTFCIAYAFCLMLSAVGYWASMWFVTRIYKAIKSD